MAELEVQVVDLEGLDPEFVAADAEADGYDEFVNSGRAFIHVINADDPTSRTVTVDCKTNCSQGHDHDAVVVVAGPGEALIGPFPKNRFNDGYGKVRITYDDETDLTIAVIEVP